MKSLTDQSVMELIQKRQAIMAASKPPHPSHVAKLMGISDELYHHISKADHLSKLLYSGLKMHTPHG